MTERGKTESERRFRNKQARVWGSAFLLIAALASGSVPVFGRTSARLARATHAYKTALLLRKALTSKPIAQQSEADYEKAIRAFRAVYLADAAYSKAPVSLAMAGELYAEMGRQFHDTSASERSVKEYKLLISQYPGSPMARHALLTIGEIYRNDLQDTDRARKVFQQYLATYPKSEGARAAEDNLRQIVESLSEVPAEKSPAAKVPPASSGDEESGGAPQVTDIRDWVGPNYTRVVIAVQGQVKFDTLRLSNPDRIVLDLQDARLSPGLVGKAFPVESGFLRQIRVGQFKPDVARVVLDVEKLEAYSIFPLPNPYRLIIDVHGPQAERNSEEASRERLTRTAEKASKHEEANGQKPAPSEKEAGNSTMAESAEAGQKRPVAPASKTKTDTGHVSTQTASLKKTPPPAKSQASHTPAPALIRAAEPTANGSQTLTRALGLKVARIVIDPGHGGHDTGTIGPGGIEEKNVVLDVAKRLKKLLVTETGSEVILTRRTDEFIPLEERTAIANEKGADLFISIHANASRDPDARGIETYYLNFTTDPEALQIAARENATSQESVHQLQSLIKKIALTEKVEESQEFARDVQHDLTRRMARIGDPEPNRGVKKAPFVVLIGANMPSILAEISFLTNPHDASLLRKGSFRQQIAEALFHGILDYMRNLGSVNVAERTSPGQPAAQDPPARLRKAVPRKDKF
jgi:N-acetylmuramoyl-L-alanine amidase